MKNELNKLISEVLCLIHAMYPYLNNAISVLLY